MRIKSRSRSRSSFVPILAPSPGEYATATQEDNVENRGKEKVVEGKWKVEGRELCQL